MNDDVIALTSDRKEKPLIETGDVGFLTEIHSLFGTISGSLVEKLQIGHRVFVGLQKTEAEVIELSLQSKEDSVEALICFLEHNNDLKTGDIVQSSFQTGMIELGPGLLGAVIDSLGRRLEWNRDTREYKHSVTSTDLATSWNVKIIKNLQEGQKIYPGECYGWVFENTLKHHLFYPITLQGAILSKFAPSGQYIMEEPLFYTREAGQVSLARKYPIDQPFLFRRALELGTFSLPFIHTNDPYLDLIFPLYHGVRAGIIASSDRQRRSLQEKILSSSNVDVFIYITDGCDRQQFERLLQQLEQKFQNTNLKLRDRTIILTNTTALTSFAHHSMLQIGMTIAEYYREQGHKVLIYFDSLSSWSRSRQEFYQRRISMKQHIDFQFSILRDFRDVSHRAGSVVGIGSRTGSITLITSLTETKDPLTTALKNEILRTSVVCWHLPDSTEQISASVIDLEKSFQTYENIENIFQDCFGRIFLEDRRWILNMLEQGYSLEKITSRSFSPDEQRIFEKYRIIRKLLFTQTPAFFLDSFKRTPEELVLLLHFVKILLEDRDTILNEESILQDLHLLLTEPYHSLKNLSDMNDRMNIIQKYLTKHDEASL